MIKRIFKSIFFVAVLVFFACMTLIVGALYGYFSDVQKTQLKTQTEFVAQNAEMGGIEYIETIDAESYRLTWIASDGSVLYDNYGDQTAMSNHLQREEIQQALKTGYGEGVRTSETLETNFLYSAKLLNDGSVIRLSVTQNTVLSLLMDMTPLIIVVVSFALILSLVLAFRLSENIVKPLNELDLNEPLKNENYDELEPLLKRIISQQQELKEKTIELKNRQTEFETVTNSMTEGLVLLNCKGTVLSLNNAAADLLGTGSEAVGKNILTINQNKCVSEILSGAIAGESEQRVITVDGRYYQVEGSPVITGNAISGMALLMFDVTERENAEHIRREFTANVSHELKTPLHTISGYAELMKHGMVKSEDVPNFSSKIYTEAQRLSQLVEDILNLSHLDEGAEGMNRIEVDIYELCQSNIRSLESQAEAAGVNLILDGEKGVINGIPQLLGSIVSNLCDNGIKYNKEGGEVKVTVTDSAEEVVLKVADTGIGIPPEHQGRIFERFYRVDKSRSKEVGGTGLGLSIVKHAVKIHNAKVELSSTLGQGTTITVTFPK